MTDVRVQPGSGSVGLTPLDETDPMPAPAARDAKPFVPAKDFAASLAFYTDLGWTQNWNAGGLAELELAGARLLLQDFYAKDWAENWMLYVDVDDADAWYAHARRVIADGRHPGARTAPPKDEPYGARVTYVWDPCGVLLHFAQALPAGGGR